MNTLVLKSVRWSAIGVWGRAAIALVTLLVMSRLLLAEEYGLFALAFFVMRLAALFLGGSLAEAITQERTRDARLATSTFWLMAIGSLVLWGAMIVGAGVFARLFSTPALTDMLPILGIYCPLVAMSAVPVALLMRDMRYDAINRAELIAAAAGSAAGITAAALGAGAWSLAILEVVNATLRGALCWQASGFRPGAGVDLRLWPGVLRRNWGSLGARALQFLTIQMPRAAIGTVLGQAALGYFVFASGFFERIAGLLLAPIGSVALSAVARAQDDREALHRLLAMGFFATSALVSPVFLGMVAIAPDLIPLVFGARWEPSVIPAQLLLLIGVRAAIGAFTISILRGVGLHAMPVSLMAAEVAAMAIALPIAVGWGLNAACLALLIVQLIMTPISAWTVARATGFSMLRQLKSSGPGLAAGLLMMLAVGALAVQLAPVWPVWGRLAACIAVGAVLYAGLLAVFAPGPVGAVINDVRKRRGINRSSGTS